MPGTRPARGALLAFALWSAACSLVVAPDELSDGCPAELKPCGGSCVSRTDPDFGCDADTCRPCLIPQATARCNAAGACVVATCLGRFADCNADGDEGDSDGCETDTAHDPLHCGSCDAEPCRVDNGSPACAGGSCSIARCSEGFHDCNFDASDGCESELAVSCKPAP